MTTFYSAFIYDLSTGEIIRRTMCSDEDGPMLVASVGAQGLGIVLTTDPNAGQWSDATHRVEGGEVVPRPGTT
jgi:hypothetical protein